MSALADRYRRIAGAFTARVVAVAPDAWDRPAPCEGWVARDVVGHLFDVIATNDVFLHTWDLARATGLDEQLDPVEVHALLDAMEPTDALLRESGQFGPRVPVADDADEQTRLLAFIGRRP